MKSKTKTILIFAAILTAVFLIAFLDGGAVQSAADEEEEGTLIGAFVSEEDIDIGGDLAVSAAGKFVWKAGRLYMETDDWSALGERGGGLYPLLQYRDGSCAAFLHVFDRALPVYAAGLAHAGVLAFVRGHGDERGRGKMLADALR